METTGIIGVILGLYRGCIEMRLYWDNGKKNGSYYSILELYRGYGKENGTYYSILEEYRDNGKENGNHYIRLFRAIWVGLWVPYIFSLIGFIGIQLY